MLSALPSLSVCEAEDDLGTQILGWILTVGAAASFLPQIFTLLISKNLDGLSALTWMLNYLSNMMTMVNAIMLNWTEIQCCEELPFGKCLEAIVPLVQLAGPTICTFITFALTMVYADHMTEQQKLTEETLRLNSRKSAENFFDYIFGVNSFIVQCFIASIIITIIASAGGVLMMVFAGVTNDYTIIYAKVAGILAVVLLMVMYIPQLYTTYKAKHTGSLSVITLLIQAPGSIAVCYFDAILSHLSWTTWMPYLVSAIQQIVLIFMCIYYHFRNKRLSQKGETLETTETDPLLAPLPKKEVTVN